MLLLRKKIILVYIAASDTVSIMYLSSVASATGSALILQARYCSCILTLILGCSRYQLFALSYQSLFPLIKCFSAVVAVSRMHHFSRKVFGEGYFLLVMIEAHWVISFVSHEICQKITLYIGSAKNISHKVWII